MTCINCNGSNSHLLRMPSSSWLHITVPCEDCAAERRGEVEYLDTRPDDRRFAAYARYDGLSLQAAWARGQLSSALCSDNFSVDRISVLKVSLASAIARKKSAWDWMLRWDELVLENQRLGAQS